MARLFNTFPFAQVDDASLAAMMRIAPKDVDKTRQAYVARFRDPGQAQKVLDELPAPSLLVLATLVDAGGMMPTSELSHTAKVELGMSAADLQRAITPIIQHLLAVPLTTVRRDSMLALVTPAAEAIAPYLVDVDLAPSDEAAFVPDPPTVLDGRATLAVCMALRHLDIKITNDERPHRAATKRLAKQIGLSEDVVAKIIIAARTFGLVGIDADDNYRPATQAVIDAAIGSYADEVVQAIAARLDSGPVAIGVLDRWRREMISPLDPNTLSLLPGVVTGTLGGLAAVARATHAGTAAGHVTPSFEVMLPPESRLVDIVAVAGCCDLVRVDRVIVAKLTSASVSRAIAAGMTAAEIADSLAGASKSPLPQNVEVAIRDWAGATTSAVIDEGIVIAVAPSLADKVRPALAGFEARELGNGTFVVSSTTSRAQLDAALAKVGVRAHREVIARRPSISKRQLRPIDQGSPALRKRVAAWRANDPVERKRDRAVQVLVPVGDLDDRPANVPSVKAINDVVEALAVWERAYRRMPKDELKTVIALFAQISPALWRPILANATNLDQLRDGIEQLLASGQVDHVLREIDDVEEIEVHADDLDWHGDQLAARLGELESDELVVIDHAGKLTELRFDRMIQRGASSLVLGEDTETGLATAIRLDTITRISILAEHDLDAPGSSARASARGVKAAPRGPYRGPPIAGHLPCPCGSGKRYRECCRGNAS